MCRNEEGEDGFGEKGKRNKTGPPETNRLNQERRLGHRQFAPHFRTEGGGKDQGESAVFDLNSGKGKKRGKTTHVNRWLKKGLIRRKKQKFKTQIFLA